jgi:hypothetical protein
MLHDSAEGFDLAQVHRASRPPRRRLTITIHYGLAPGFDATLPARAAMLAVLGDSAANAAEI